MKRLVGYARVSTAGQADKGVSLAAQTAKIEAMCAVQDGVLVGMIVDAGESAKSLDRPGMVQLLELIESRSVDGVIVAKLDRLTRSVRDLADLIEILNKRDVKLISVAESLDTGSAAGRLVINLLGAVSCWERETGAERTRAALAHKKARGERIGSVRFGYRLASDGVHLEVEPSEQRIIDVIRDLRNSGLSLQAIADRLNADGVRTRRGTEWRNQYVHNALRAVAC